MCTLLGHITVLHT